MTIDVRSTPRRGFDEVFLTAAAADVQAAGHTFAGLAAALRQHGVEPLAEKVYGALVDKEAILAARAAALREQGLEPSLPCTFVDGAPAAGGGFGGVQVWGIRARTGHGLQTVPGGRLWQAPTFRVLQLCNLHGAAGDVVTHQAQQMFAAAAAAAQQNGFDYAQVVRTWIYLPRLLDWYGEFNRVRTACYRQYDFALPASTGIQGRDGDHECLMDALLVDGVPCRSIDRSERQGPAPAYGSSFSRGVELAYEGGSTVHVSGTASIDPAGRSIHLGDPQAQFLEMLMDIGAVLQEAGMTLRDIQQATLFCKDAATYSACLEARARLCLPAFPTLCVRADVCRHELLVEMEAVASR